MSPFDCETYFQSSWVVCTRDCVCHAIISFSHGCDGFRSVESNQGWPRSKIARLSGNDRSLGIQISIPKFVVVFTKNWNNGTSKYPSYHYSRVQFLSVSFRVSTRLVTPQAHCPTGVLTSRRTQPHSKSLLLTTNPATEKCVKTNFYGIDARILHSIDLPVEWKKFPFSLHENV